jgi:uncharacterized protein (DUF2147 family)
MTRHVLPALILAASSLPAWAGSPGETSGTWLTEDGRARIRMERCGAANDRLCGYVVWLRDGRNADGTPKVDAYNPDVSKRTRPALGIQLLKGLALNDEGRFAGKIYNADNGKSYDVTVWSEASGELNVRGCLMSYLCKTQDWKRTSDVAPGQLAGVTGSANGPFADGARPVLVTGGVAPAKAAQRKAGPAAAQPAVAVTPAAED